MTGPVYDIAVIGGGINGAGIAAEAARRGLRVLLAEAEDIGGATSSASSKLIHGGLRYLEHFEFRLVRAALAEREILLKKAPHIVRPLEFVLPEVPGMRPGWMLRAGLFLYDHLSGRRTLGGSRVLDLTRDPLGEILKPGARRGFSYWDCQVDDARLVVLNAMAARESGADVFVRTPVTALEVRDGHWQVSLGARRQVVARAVFNVTGPWVDGVARLGLGPTSGPVPRVRLVKGSHIVVPRIAGADRGYLLQNDDGRVVFLLPFEAAFTLIGTTESAYSGDPRAARADPSDRAYLLAAVNRFLRVPLAASDIVWDFAGVRPLDDDGHASASAVSRDYRFVVESDAGPPLVHVIGGKITTYRRLAAEALARLSGYLAMGPAGPAEAPLPGGDVGDNGFAGWFDELAARRAGIDRSMLRLLARRYGTRIERLLGEAQTVADLGALVGGGLFEREVLYLKREEFAQQPDDVIWRRTKAGLNVSPGKRAALADRVQSVLDRG